MNFVSARTERTVRRNRRRRGFTLTEMLIALTIAMAFISGVYVVFITVLQAQRDMAAQVEAMRNGRAAIMSLTDEIKRINTIDTGVEVLLLGFSNVLDYGDGIDNDDDGTIDEEQVDGRYNTLPGLTNPAAFDSHALLGPTMETGPFERPAYVGRPDVGDQHLDVDARFGRDVIQFRIFSENPSPDFNNKTITYAVTEFEGESNVLVRQTRIEREDAESLIGLAPIAFNVLGFDLLYWNPNAQAREQGWVTTWDSSLPPSVPGIGQNLLRLPASVYVRVTIHADTTPFAEYLPGDPVQTILLDSMVNLEEVIDSTIFNNRRLLL